MSTIVIPTRTDGVPHYDLEIELDGKTYGLELRWSERAGAWFLTLSDGEGAVLVAGRKVVLDRPLLAQYRAAGVPPGDLVALDTTHQAKAPGLYELGDRVVLVYVEAER